MEKEQEQKPATENNTSNNDVENEKVIHENEIKSPEKDEELDTDTKIKSLEDKLTRTLAEMENQRRRFEKEKEDAFEYGGTSFAKEALSLIDNLERSKQILENDEKLKNSDALKKTLDHLEIINKDLISIFHHSLKYFLIFQNYL